MDHYSIPPNKTILVLNASYEPLNFTSGKRAILLVIKNKAEVLGNLVVRLLHFVRLPYERIKCNRPVRRLVYLRDKNKCQYCGSTKRLTIDHIIPSSRGGKDTWENLTVACFSCNILKGDKFLSETNLKLRTKPRKPINKMLFSLDNSNVPEWQKYNFKEENASVSNFDS